VEYEKKENPPRNRAKRWLTKAAGEVGDGANWEIRIDIYTILCIK